MELVLENVWKEMGMQTILADVHLTLRPGEVLVVTGDNGAGKTTLLRAICGLTPLSSGRIAGVPRGRIGLLGHQPMVYGNLTVEENLVFFAQLAGTYNAALIEDALAQIRLATARGQLVQELSRGMAQRLSLGRLLVQQALLFLYDEPFSSLDATSCNWLREVLYRLQQQNCLQLVVTHNVAELGSVVTRMVRLHRGRVIEHV